MTVIGIEKLQLKQDTGNWEDAEEKYVAYVGDNLQIKALIAPSGVTWPSDIPTWQGNFSDTSLSDTRIVDTSQTDEFTITAECGTSQKCVEIEVKPVELKIPPAVLRDGQAENPQNTLLNSLTILLLPWGSENQSALPEWHSNAAERLRATCESRCRSLCMLRRMNTELRAAAHRLHFRQRDSSFV